MEYLHSLFDTKISEPTAVTVGKFDGIHRGHNLLTSDIISKKSQGLKSCLITFTNSPRFLLQEDQTPCLITNKERMFMLDNNGLDYLIECPFDERLMQTDARSFIEFLVSNLNMQYIISGPDFTFGHKGAGNVQLLTELSKELGFEYKVIEKMKQNNRDISSTYIREELKEGHIDSVNEMLGYEYFVWGEVVHGAHLGHTIGIPTINIMPEKIKLVPKFGVYVTTIDFDGRIYHGVTNVGTKPSVSDKNIVGIETHILDYNGDLYGKFVKVTFQSFLRPEMKFGSIEELTNQMNIDKTKAKNFFNKK
ncbi:bifunctional riboflavin kinase/FAD synthetase [Pseudobutyrivibrio xylanivorans]|uniref:Riboflavin biosynthesis protein n=1 Tax=Pseudobutyrivibrio xylanivorans DSM 14809 TaxID=1123012 RepID=A0A1M6BU30_PSEXY|nr:bifunctional riboflavin kinase/FAD synthetase [Pseudobutyrivibrio xylanivorans]SHI52265.1 riboflavin kinase / FMN adenylyltransferase [Pseudobutyrivibrio xylanivorans DSM 14809]